MHTVAEVSLKYQTNTTFLEKPEIKSPEEAASFLRKIWDQDTLEFREEFVVILLNNAKKVLGWSKVSTGSPNTTIVHPATVFQLVLLGNAASIIIAHNHPSGILKASLADLELTKRLVKAGKLFSVFVDDHIIITRDGYLSMREEGLMKEG